jgi:hypothetical protein
MTTSNTQPKAQPSNQAEQEYVDLSEDENHDPSSPETFPSGNTVEADRRDAVTLGHADRMPTPEEEAAAPTELDPKTAQAYEEALERGANVKGEGEID